MVAASLWKRSDIDRIEASLYRKVLRIGNMVSNRAILNTMTNIRLAGEVTNYLSKEAWEQFRRQNRVTAFFTKKEENERTNSAVGHQLSNKDPLPRREIIYVPKIMLNMMLATTSNSTTTFETPCATTYPAQKLVNGRCNTGNFFHAILHTGFDDSL